METDAEEEPSRFWVVLKEEGFTEPIENAISTCAESLEIKRTSFYKLVCVNPQSVGGKEEDKYQQVACDALPPSTELLHVSDPRLLSRLLWLLTDAIDKTAPTKPKWQGWIVAFKMTTTRYCYQSVLI